MCIAIPVRVLAVDGYVARVLRGGETAEVSLVLMSEDVAVGDFVVLQAGRYAVARMSAEHARDVLNLFESAVEEGFVACGAPERGEVVG